MTVSAISNIAIAIGITEFLGCMFSRKFIFQSDSYTRTVEKFERAKWRRDSTAASLATKQANPKSQKSAGKIKLCIVLVAAIKRACNDDVQNIQQSF